MLQISNDVVPPHVLMVSESRSFLRFLLFFTFVVTKAT
jgi:hypothetical protein